ncbi:MULTISPECIES: hypothetical protein [Bacillus cereus group]|uniref:Beta-channel forming cytolysin n=3 Tax=Bacillus cereus group TaxID=86661 RepID=A0A0J1HXG6_BACAN|nr:MULTISPECIES: hypothetical protein [Bacillus cereus group]EOQ19725.1 hypothetical protein IKC_04199 [Bacillus cereus VD184]KLV18382.1 hypothetical protein ABW01_13470 [Bacillus anthracis]ONG72179.1 hypothetical protein BKK44_10350 [Bacillus cereus]OUB76937.1 hypothetical protein BK750_03445 [Bacillus thuringiensis serovar jegathesan]
MKKVLASLSLGAMLALSSPLFASADSNNDQQVLTGFLESVKSNDIQTALTYTDDNRFESYEEKKSKYEGLFKKDQLISYKNIEKQEDGTYTAELSFLNGGSAKVPFNVLSDKVNISFDSLENSKYEVIKKGTEPVELKTLATLVSWDFWARAKASVFYSNGTFSISGSSATLKLSQNNDSDLTPGITYAVVQQHWYGDDVWGSRRVQGRITNGSYNITGSGSYTGAQMRFTTDSDPYMTRYNGTGSLSR